MPAIEKQRLLACRAEYCDSLATRELACCWAVHALSGWISHAFVVSISTTPLVETENASYAVSTTPLVERESASYAVYTTQLVETESANYALSLSPCPVPHV